MAIANYGAPEQIIIKKNMIDGLELLHQGEVTKYEDARLSPCDIIDYVTDVLGEEDRDIPFDHTNGWDVDWWYEFNYKGKVYSIHGSAYYGGLEIYKK